MHSLRYVGALMGVFRRTRRLAHVDSTARRPDCGNSRGAVVGIEPLESRRVLATFSLSETFDAGTSQYVLKNYQGVPASVAAEPGHGNVLNLTYASVGGTLNTVAFGSLSPQPFVSMAAEFDLRMEQSSRADGLGFTFLNADVFGNDGAAPLISEDPSIAKSLGVGFDTYLNGPFAFTGSLDDTTNDVTLHYDGKQYASFPLKAIDLANGNFLHVTIQVSQVPDGCEVSVTIRDTRSGTVAIPFDRFLIPGMSAYAGRPAFGARTGTNDSGIMLDNVSILQTTPSITIDPLRTPDVRPTLTGTVDDPDANVTVSLAGTTYAATNHRNGRWSLPGSSLVAPLPRSLYDVVASSALPGRSTVVDRTMDELWVIDPAAPSAIISTTTSTIAGGLLPVVTFRLSEDVDGFDASDIAVTSGYMSGFTGSRSTYFAAFSPYDSFKGNGFVSIPAGAFVSRSGKANSAASLPATLAIDTLSPKVAVAAVNTQLNVGEPVSIRFGLSEQTSGFTLADVVATGGTVTNLQGGGAGYWATFTPTPGYVGAGSVNVMANAFLGGNGSPSLAATLPVPLSIGEYQPPPAPGIALGPSISGGATRAEATQASGVVKVTGNNGNQIRVTFVGTTNGVADNAKTFVREVTGQGDATSVAVSLTDSGVDALGNGLVYVTAVQVSPAGKASPLATISFMLDTVAPAAPVISLGVGVAEGVTYAEAVQAEGVVTVRGEPGATIVVTFVRLGGGQVTLMTVGQGSGTPVAVALAAGDLSALGQGTVNVSAVQTDSAGNASPAGTTSFMLDTVAPIAPAVALGFSVADGATKPEALQGGGIVTAAGEAGSQLVVSFVGTTSGRGDTAKIVTKVLTGQGASVPLAVVLTEADLTKLGDGIVYVVASAIDAAGNQSPATVVPLTLDTAVPAAPVLALGPGVAWGATRAEALQAAGVVTVRGERDAVIIVSFVGTTNGQTDAAKIVTKTVIGQGGGVPVAVTLAAADLVKLTDGLVYAVSTQVDAAGNQSGNQVVSFPLDTVAPRIQAFAATAATNSVGPGRVIRLTATVSEDAPEGAAVNVVLSTGVSVRLVAAAAGRQLTGSYTVAPGQAAAPLRVTRYTSAGGADLAGNPLDTSGALPPMSGSSVTVAGAIRVNTPTGFSSAATRVPDLNVAQTSIPIVFNTPVTGLTLNSFRLSRDDRPVALAGARLSRSGVNWTLTLSTAATNPTGIYTLTILATGIRATANNAPMSANSLIYWGKGRSVR